MLQSEFKGYHRQNSITWMTGAQSQLDNKLDDRFKKEMLINEPKILNEQYRGLGTKSLS